AKMLSDQETMEQLIELGYVERPDEKKETAILKTKCDLQHNLARVYMGKKENEKAISILLELLEEKDEIDIAPYYFDLVKIYVRIKDFEKAEEYLNLLKDHKTEVKYNLFFLEAEILEGLHKPIKAMNLLIEKSRTHRNPKIFYRIGLLKFSLGDFKEAEQALETAIEIEPDRANYHQAMAETQYEMGEYEEAVEYALTSIELVRYFPKAHYILGKALEKLGDMENAKLAFETASKLTPKSHARAEKALENVNERIQEQLEFVDKSEFKYREDQIVVVSGLPRSGTSLMMQMLHNGGMEALVDDKREADISNPKGYFEYEPVMSIHKDNSWLPLAKNKSVKIVAPLLRYINPDFRYKVIFMKRDLDEIIKSQQKMLGKNPDTLPVKIYNAFHTQLQTVARWKEREPGVELLYVDYAELVDDPDALVEKIKSFLGLKSLDSEKMKKSIDKKLYRNRVTVK
ncbi:MAG: tetratricopeptide repeat protein, partial [Flavobacteriaceae bacterium]|nr:tetratricopeptide repeat protein [Flavobacteriaceae bacterium]